MAVARINGKDFERMLKAGLIKIRNHESEINDMNVFPVPDGDTGTNLRLTLQNGILTTPSNENLGEFLGGIKKGMLLGARGNSGVILSQFFTGIADSLKNKSAAGAEDLFESFVAAYKTAYGSVVNPVEGTVLTVARLGIENIRENLPSFSGSIDSMLSAYIAEMKNVLMTTPELLPVLKESGVLDSGGAGYIYILRGILEGLLGCDSDFDISNLSASAKLPAQNLDTDRFTRDSVFEEGYCTEFILQLMGGSQYDQSFNLDLFIENLKAFGNSIVAFRTDDRVKVHIHTMKPYMVVELAQRYGEFVTFKMENMQIQKDGHEFRMKKIDAERKHKKIAVVAVVNGEGIRGLYESFGCDIILDGGSTMNTSSQEFVDAFNQLDADNIIVLPNSKNIFFAAKQAIEISGRKNISILECSDQIEGYYALAMGQVCIDDFDERLSLMREGASGVDVLSITFASKPYSQNNVSCEKGDCIAFLNGSLVASSTDLCTTLSSAVKNISDLDSKYSCMIAAGKHADEKMTELVQKCLENILPDVEINVVQGGQDVMHFMIGL